MSDFKVGYFVGSLAKGSINRKLAKALVGLAPAELKLQEISFRDLTLKSMLLTAYNRYSARIHE
jgi:chromate reductase